MGLKIICGRAAPASETIGGDETPRHFSAGGCGIALSPAGGRADAKQPGETASRLLRIVPPSPETPICWRSFAVLSGLFSPAKLPAIVSLCLHDMALRLLRIARSRADRDLTTVASEAHAIGRIAGNLGAPHIRTAAHQLEEACRTGDYAATYSLLSILSQACDEAETELNSWLMQHPAMRGA
jgi:HPt (histidine-containing phosphotransfer) domain-containing protein